MSRLSIFAIATLALLTAGVALDKKANAAPIFNVTDLGRLVGTGLNNAGQVVGNGLDSATGAPPGGGGFLYDGYGPNAGTIYAFANPFQPLAINDSGLMIGSASNGDGAFAYGTAGGTVTTIQNGNPLLGTVSTINSQGQVLLNEWGPVGLFHTIIHASDGSNVEIPHLQGQPIISGTGINDSGQVAGYTGQYNTAMAFLYSQGVLHSLGTLPGDSSSMAYALNNAGQVVGVSQGTSASHAFLYSNGAMQNLGTLGGSYSAAQGINASGEIYGQSTLANGTMHEFLYEAGKMLDLTNLLHSLAGPISQYTYYYVNGINDHGQLLVLALNTNEDFHSFLLTPDGQPVPTTPTSSAIVVPVTVSPYTPPPAPAPVPEPSVLAFFGVIVAASAGRRLLQRSRQ